ncbi:FUSC family protein [Nocardioides sp. BP30]|uniref:FUSC family protein n=1 Tax=Nocardioides sp. BP30 TaxID=3036374 RepID=UPI0024693088|nr:FUSC family protein [Nocardioides sp. BP30]WGL51235.1 FUSC family protein [Nocardioides sp. BP30]
MSTTSWRAPAVAMLAVLGTWLTAWRLEVARGLHLDVVVLATVLAVTLARVVSRERPRAAAPYLLRIATLPLIALLATEVGRLLVRHPVLGGVAFVLVLSGAVYLRRFGSWWTRLGTLVSLPFIALLVVPVPVDAGTASTWWPAVFAMVAFGWVVAVHLLAWGIGFLPAPPEDHGSDTAARSGRASTRMAAQLAVGLAVSYGLGRWLMPEHWPWLVLSCYVVCSGNRGRGDVLHKGVLRLVGALVGTGLATVIAGRFVAGDRWAIVLLFAVMAAALWARQRSYAWWAAGVTAMVALLHGYVGIGGAGELGQRLIGVALGAVIGVLASWLVLPVRSRDVYRRRRGDALIALKELRDALRAEEGVAPARRRYEAAVEELVLLEPLWKAHGRLRPRHAVALGEPAALIRRLVALRADLAGLSAQEALGAVTAALRASLTRPTATKPTHTGGG